MIKNYAIKTKRFGMCAVKNRFKFDHFVKIFNFLYDFSFITFDVSDEKFTTLIRKQHMFSAKHTIRIDILFMRNRLITKQKQTNRNQTKNI